MPSWRVQVSNLDRESGWRSSSWRWKPNSLVQEQPSQGLHVWQGGHQLYALPASEAPVLDSREHWAPPVGADWPGRPVLRGWHRRLRSGRIHMRPFCLQRSCSRPTCPRLLHLHHHESPQSSRKGKNILRAFFRPFSALFLVPQDKIYVKVTLKVLESTNELGLSTCEKEFDQETLKNQLDKDVLTCIKIPAIVGREKRRKPQ